MKIKVKIAFFLLAGLATGAAFAKLDFPGYKHAMVVIGKGAETNPLYINGDGGRQVLALTMKNCQRSRGIEIRMDGAEIRSWYPPVIELPFQRWPTVEGGRFKGVDPGKRLPVYVAFRDNGENRKIEIVDSTDGSLIRTIDILRGKANGRHHH